MKKAKGVKNNVVKKDISHPDYVDCLFEERKFMHTMQTIQSTPSNHSHKKRKIVWKQTKHYCFNSFNPNFLEPRPPNLHKNCKRNKVELIRYYFLERRYSASFICQKCLAKTVQYQVAVFQEKIKELAFSKFYLQITNLTRSGAKILSTLFWNTNNVINL